MIMREAKDQVFRGDMHMCELEEYLQWVNREAFNPPLDSEYVFNMWDFRTHLWERQMEYAVAKQEQEKQEAQMTPSEVFLQSLHGEWALKEIQKEVETETDLKWRTVRYHLDNEETREWLGIRKVRRGVYLFP